jgi:hypothetical protein
LSENLITAFAPKAYKKFKLVCTYHELLKERLADEVCKNGNEDKKVQYGPIYHLFVFFSLFALESLT